MKKVNRYVNLGISAEDMMIRLDGLVDERDLEPFKYPPMGWERTKLSISMSWKFYSME